MNDTLNGKKIFLLLVVYLVIIIGFAYTIQALDVYPVVDWVVEKLGFREEKILKKEDKTLLKKEQLNKKEISLHELETHLKARETYLNEYNENIEKIKHQIINKSNELHEKEVQIATREKNFVSRKVAIAYLANSITKLPPQQAVEIIKGLDDKLMIDIFREINRKAEVEEQTSVVELLLKELPYKMAEQKDGTTIKKQDPIGLKKAINYYKFQAKFPEQE